MYHILTPRTVNNLMNKQGDLVCNILGVGLVIIVLELVVSRKFFAQICDRYATSP